MKRVCHLSGSKCQMLYWCPRKKRNRFYYNNNILIILLNGSFSRHKKETQKCDHFKNWNDDNLFKPNDRRRNSHILSRQEEMEMEARGPMEMGWRHRVRGVSSQYLCLTVLLSQERTNERTNGGRGSSAHTTKRITSPAIWLAAVLCNAMKLWYLYWLSKGCFAPCMHPASVLYFPARHEWLAAASIHALSLLCPGATTPPPPHRALQKGYNRQGVGHCRLLMLEWQWEPLRWIGGHFDNGVWFPPCTDFIGVVSRLDSTLDWNRNSVILDFK